ncbi:glycosyltransferase [Paracoccus xiamenensis]|uniref:glycosyltransferase n=1 Tax=Paracoccus xiamenensis TaxID=2714901 RepID=UPI001408152F|nr:glycosyltransferase [Paracoccus xiamenensis]NHF73679.1 glycosyltransferase [Paracoccus xiamenensis]
MARVMIGLALYNGAEHVAAQLDSIAAQDHRDWRLVVSDDGSSDAGPRIVRDFAARFPDGQVTLVQGPRGGATRNFLAMLAMPEADEYLSLADQDDVWRPDKLSRAIAALQARPEAGLYSACTTICDAQLKPLVGSKRFAGPFNFRNALVQAVTAGNTCVLTPAAIQLVRQAAPAAMTVGVESHDWWLYQAVSGAGMGIIRDDAEVLLYRQHGDNLKGRNDTIPAMKARLAQLFAGDYGGWLHLNVAALSSAPGLLTPENEEVLARFSAALGRPGWFMAREFARLGLRRQTLAGTAALYAAALGGRLRRKAEGQH